MRVRDESKGLTLIELIVVMVIIAIGAAMLAPNIGAWMPIYRLKGATPGRGLHDAGSTGKSGVEQHLVPRLLCSWTEQIFSRKFPGFGANWAKEGDDQVLPTGVQLNTSFTGNTAIFYPDSTATAGTVTITNTKGSQKTIQLWGTTGRIKHG